MVHFPTPGIKYVDQDVSNRKLKIGSFSLIDGQIGSYHLDIRDANPHSISRVPAGLDRGLVTKIIDLLQFDDLQWVIGESVSGLFVNVSYIHEIIKFNQITDVELYVYVPESIYTFCKLKFKEIA